jgi:hypothetical protein
VRVMFLADGFVLQAITDMKDSFSAGGPGSVTQVPSSPQLRSLEATLHRRCTSSAGVPSALQELTVRTARGYRGPASETISRP